MNNKSDITMNHNSTILNLISWLFGILFLAIGIINTFWGNDLYFGLFIIGLSFAYYPPVTSLIRKWLGIGIPAWVKIVLGIFIIWAAIGVGELPNKIELMKMDLSFSW